jgi:hypothetical protein
MAVVTEVFALNIGLAVLAIASTMIPSTAIRLCLLLLGGAATALVMYRFSRRAA